MNIEQLLHDPLFPLCLIFIPSFCYCITASIKMALLNPALLSSEKNEGVTLRLWHLSLEWFFIHVFSLPLLVGTLLAVAAADTGLPPFFFIAVPLVLGMALYLFNRFYRQGKLAQGIRKEVLVVCYIIMTLCQIAIIGSAPATALKLITFLQTNGSINKYLKDWDWYSYGMVLSLPYSFLFPLRLRYELSNLSLGYRTFDLLFVTLLAGYIHTRVFSEYEQYGIMFPLLVAVIWLSFMLLLALFAFMVPRLWNNKRKSNSALVLTSLVEAVILGLFPFFVRFTYEGFINLVV